MASKLYAFAFTLVSVVAAAYVFNKWIAPKLTPGKTLGTIGTP